MNWRIYRLPGSREVWHIDAGPGTQIFNVKSWECFEGTESVDIGGSNVPRAWIQIQETELHLISGKAVFGFSSDMRAVKDALAEIAAIGDGKKCAAVPD